MVAIPRNVRPLLEWYNKLHPRQVDLIGDYAGNELFVIHGESLLLRCFDTDDIDFDGGFQLLHAVHAVEAFLFGLVQRKCNFHISFFGDHEDLCIPTRARLYNYHKYRLTRAVIIRHLQVHLPRTHPQVKLNVYKTLKSPRFAQYLATNGVYFVMAHDGASSKPVALPAGGEQDVSDSDETSEEDQSDDDVPTANSYEQRDGKSLHRKTIFRAMIYWFARKGHYIALINGLKWQDTKVMTMVLEGSRLSKGALDESVDRLLADDELNHPNRITEGNVSIAPLSPSSNVKITSEAQKLVVHCLRRLLSADQISFDAAQAIIVHSAILSEIPLSRRRIKYGESGDQSYLEKFSVQACSILSSPGWADECMEETIFTDVADLIDGRILAQVNFKLKMSKKFDVTNPAIRDSVGSMIEAIALDDGPMLSSSLGTKPSPQPTSISNGSNRKPKSHNLLPFSDRVFDHHLASVHVTVDDPTGDQLSNTRARVFRDATHWHTTKPVLTRTLLPEQQRLRALRSNQFFMREMTQYAASLTNAVGKSLEPETVITGQGTLPASFTTTGKAAKLMAENAVTMARKNEKKFLDAWKSQIKEFELIPNPEKRYMRVKYFLEGLTGEKKTFLQSEIELYLLNCLLLSWSSICRSGKQTSSPQVAALMFDLLVRLGEDSTITRTMHAKLQLTSQSLGLPYIGVEPPAVGDRSLAFSYLLSKAADPSLKVSDSSSDFQLSHCGPYFDRSIGSSVDDRVRFKPDAWQKDVLDVLDKEKSVFVVAPTSAGKTFISFYAMKQILKADDDGVLIYVAPTKALVNQIAAELQANFSKKFKHGGKSVWAIHTRDYRVNNPTGCQVLVTVPHILQIMLMSPANARSWAPRVRRIIFDEIHSIGQAEDGIIWEQLLLLAPCPIIALSATVGNPGEFNDWLVSTQKSLGFEMVMIAHPHRYSDLRKYVFQPPQKFAFDRLSAQDSIGLASLDGVSGFAHLHPVASLVNVARGIPEDLNLEPNDCLSLWRCLKKHSNAKYPLDSALDPSDALPQIVRKIDIINWEASLKALLRTWMADTNSPFNLVVEELSRPLHEAIPESLSTANKTSQAHAIDSGDLCSTTLPLLSALNTQNALPALLFNYDRSMCEKICKALMRQLTSQEADWKESSPQWKEKLEAWERWKILELKKPKKAVAKSKKKGPKDDDDEKSSKTDLARDSGEGDSNPFANFNPDEPIEGFHFADNKRLLRSEFDEMMWKLRRRHIPEWLTDALLRGIGVHHAGMNRAYRQVVETLFRRGFLRCVVATGTLALGINMPCRTVVFSGDSIFLTALNYRQAAGRAGRRGFDLLGNVVFQNIPLEKVQRLVSSRLPDLNGHFPITTSLVLRLFILLHESKYSQYAVRAIESLLSQPRLYLGGPSFKDQVLHHLRFSIEYLRRQHLLARNGTPLNFAGCVSHLYFTEQSSFAFHALLKDGYFHSLCSKMSKKNEDRVLLELMLAMSHLFGRVWCRQADQEFMHKIHRSPSVVFLPDLPTQAKTILREHNRETLEVFTTYVKTFAAQHLEKEDRKLPLTGLLMGGEASPGKSSGIDSLPPTSVRSAFVALSGHGDEFRSISELCRTARDGVFLEEAVIPHVTLYPDESDTPLNAYLYDFYKHGDVRALAEDNGIRSGDVWFFLNDFSLVLATIVTSFRNYMNLGDVGDSDLLDTAGGGDLHEVDEDDRLAEEDQFAEAPKDTLNPAPGQPKLLPVAKQAGLGPAALSQKKKKVVADSWDDEDEGPDTDSDSDTLTAGQTTPATSQGVSSAAESVRGPSWEEGSEESLMKVLKAFERLKFTFDEKFKAMWA